MDGSLPSPARRDSHRRIRHRAGLRQALRCIGPQSVLLLGFVIALGWACAGSLAVAFGMPAAVAWAWFGALLAITAVMVGAVVVALPPKPGDKD
jgi:hypothetical protein